VLDIFAYPAYTGEKEPYGVTYYAKDVTRFVDSIKFVSMGEMSAGVAHELNSPLTAIVGNSQLLLRETDSSSPSLPTDQGYQEQRHALPADYPEPAHFFPAGRIYF
jgi:signal transduction histidine kinase